MSKILDLLGLGQIKLSVTAVLYILAGLAVAGLIGYGVYEAHEIKTLEDAAGKATQQISDLQKANAELSGQIKAQQDSAKVNDQVTVTDATQKQNAVTTTNTIASTAQNQINSIVQKYQPQGPSQVIPAAQQQAESHEIDTVQIDAMWATYCQAASADKACVQVPAKPAPAEPTAMK